MTQQANGQYSDEARMAEFEARIERGEKIEPGDWMPEAYRKQLIRMISQHAHSELVGMLPKGPGSPAPPTCGASRSSWPKCRMRQATANTSTTPPKRWGPAVKR
jgi:hypothetical protein